MAHRPAPMAFLMPISRVRSPTAKNMVFTTASDPTMTAMAPEPRIAVLSTLDAVPAALASCSGECSR